MAGNNDRVDAADEAIRSRAMLDKTIPQRAHDFVAQELPGTQIGPYQLLELLGEGGYGYVWLADQQTPVRRRVALKIIKPGMDSKEVVARFEQERQALAAMDHANVAKVFDGGRAPASLGMRPYFVMEYVKGDPITKYCDDRRLSIQERLDLFVRVCAGVQHAHHKGIIHRDLHPGNILVGDHGGEVIVKVIDFGIAKAMNTTFTQMTIFTDTGVLIGTPEYMSPEQADIGRSDVDSRSDVYTLGVLLYELLTGARPFDGAQLRSAGFAEMQRVIRDVAPPRPSTRFGRQGDAADRAERRGTRAAAMAATLERELEWIPLRAMHKDRGRRYQTCAELAEDVQNYLEGRALRAGPDSMGYRVRKLAHKHRALIAGATMVAASLVAGTIVSLGFAASEGRQRRIAESTNTFVNDDLFGSLDLEFGSPQTRVADILYPASERAMTRFSTEPAVAMSVLITISRGYIHTGQPVAALKLLESAKKLSEHHRLEHEELDALLGEARWRVAMDAGSPEAIQLLEDLVRSRESGPNSLALYDAMNLLGGAFKAMNRLDDAERVYKQSLAGRTKLLGPKHKDTLITQYNLALTSMKRGELAHRANLDSEAARWYQAALTELRPVRQDAVNVLGEEHPVTLPMHSEIASLLNRLGDFEEAKSEYERALRPMDRLLGPGHWRTMDTRFNFGRLYQKNGRDAKAIEQYERVLDAYRASPDVWNPDSAAKASSHLASAFQSVGKLELAEHELMRMHDELAAKKCDQTLVNTKCEELAKLCEKRGDTDGAAGWRGRMQGMPKP